MSTDNSDISSLKSIIENFIQEKLKTKIDELQDNKEKLEILRPNHQIENWLTDAAHRVNKIQSVTHAIKYLNPNAQGTSINHKKKSTEQNGIVSTSTLMERKRDIVCTAAVLDVAKFLQLKYNEKTLLELILTKSPILYAALPGTDEQKAKWLNAFAAATAQTSGTPSSHTLAKQIYFPTKNEAQYHLLAPLFPTSLAQAVFEQVQLQYSEINKKANEARRANKVHPQSYRKYINLAVQRFGGSNTQNISQLNSTRGGKCYLLPSLPPSWNTEHIQPPFNKKSIFKNFGRVRNLISALRKMLQIKYDNFSIRNKQKELVEEICNELLLHAANIQTLPPGWSDDPRCKLPSAYRFWLDPGRADIDPDWLEQKQLSNWQEQIYADFAHWLNSKLMTEKFRLGDHEFNQWKTSLKEYGLTLIKEAI